MSPSTPAPGATVDAQNPWLGLVSFTEETRTFFHGREEEVAELGRRVQRKLLTVLFGQSGLGKTSILQAGLVPRLRPEGYCPVYVRLDYNPQSPPPAEQIKRALFTATQSAGTWTQTGSSVAGESLWEFLHHREDVLKDAAGRTLTPILIFDQFEEIFTLAQTDEAGRTRAHEFLADLANLVENRPPAQLEERIDRDEADAARFDFARADYRILISLREDYLAHLEGLKGQMPSVTQNRMRLARMTGAQAVAAVRAPAPALVSEPVAEAIVRFVSGSTDLAHAEVEPSLLSLICRELNNTRLAQGKAEISADLLAGSRDTILGEFYERALADQPPGVRAFVEDEMLTDSGFRESVAEERVQKAFGAAGAAPDALATLVNRRLLRVEDRLDVRRVEITHDVLCSVIGASRALRREREALEDSRRRLAAQEERERATRRALFRARAVAAVAVVLMLLAGVSAVFGWINLRRARAAEAQIQASRIVTERARAQAEKLVGFLLEDFYEELLPTGRLEIVGNLAEQAVAYYDALPPELVNNQTELYRAMALVRKANAEIVRGDSKDALPTLEKAFAVFNRLRAAGDTSEAVTVGLALAYANRGDAGFLHRNAEDLTAAAKLLRPLVASGHAPRAAKLALADALNHLSHAVSPEEGVADSEESRRILAAAGASDLSDLLAASIYGDVTDTESRLELELGHPDRARALATEVGQVAERVLEKRPGDLRALKDRFLSADVLGEVYDAENNLEGSIRQARKAYDASLNYTYFNPSDFEGWLSAASASNALANDLYQQGHLAEALQQWRATTQLEKDPRNKAGGAGVWFYAWLNIARVEAHLGHLEVAQAANAQADRLMEVIENQEAAGPDFVRLGRGFHRIYGYSILIHRKAWDELYHQAIENQRMLETVVPADGVSKMIRVHALLENQLALVQAALEAHHPEAAETAARNLAALPLDPKDNADLRAEQSAQNRLALARALIARGKRGEAEALLAENLTYLRGQQAHGNTSTDFRIELAENLYQSAMILPAGEAGRARRQALLAEATSLLGALSTEAQQMDKVQDLMGRITDAQKS